MLLEFKKFRVHYDPPLNNFHHEPAGKRNNSAADMEKEASKRIR